MLATLSPYKYLIIGIIFIAAIAGAYTYGTIGADRACTDKIQAHDTAQLAAYQRVAQKQLGDLDAKYQAQKSAGDRLAAQLADTELRLEKAQEATNAAAASLSRDHRCDVSIDALRVWNGPSDSSGGPAHDLARSVPPASGSHGAGQGPAHR